MPNNLPSNLKVALVCDWLIGGGAEKVVMELHKMFPDAPIYTSYASSDWHKKLNGKVVTGYLQHWPFSHLRKSIPFLRALWFSKLKLNDFDLVISASGAEAKYIRSSAQHISYIHAPTHYYWARYDTYLKNPGFGMFNWLAKIGLRSLIGPMRKWDYAAAQKPNTLVANSTYTKDQIQRYYDRTSEVVHPPVDIEHLSRSAKSSTKEGFVVVGRQVPYKRIDLAVAACTRLKLPLLVIGNGPENLNLKNLAGPSVKFMEYESTEKTAQIVAKSSGFIFAGVDDFGIAAVEALAADTPVIAYRDGGALDYIKPGINGEFFDTQSVESLTKVLQLFDPSKYSSGDIRSSAKEFSSANFQKNMFRIIKKSL